MRDGANITQAIASLSISAPASVTRRPLPIANSLAVQGSQQDQHYVNALLQEVLPNDRIPFCEYLAKRILGIGIITVGCILFCVMLY